MQLIDGFAGLDGAANAIESLFSDIALERSSVGYMEIGSRLQTLSACKIVKELTVNGSKTDISLGESEIPVLKSLNVEVVT